MNSYKIFFVKKFTGKMLTYWKLSNMIEENGTVAATIDTTIRDYGSDMEVVAALLKMRNFLQHGTESTTTASSGVWTTTHMIKTSGNQPLLSKLKSIHVLLLETYNFFKSTSPQPEEKNYKASSICISDNYDRIKKQVKIIQKYFGERSKLPYFRNLPRIYVIAHEIVSGTGGNFDTKFLINCLKQFQTKINLNLEELWTIPVMLKLVIIEHIGLISTAIVMNSIFSKNLELIPPRNLAEFSKIVGLVDLSKSETEFLYKITVEIEKNLNGYDSDFIFPWFGYHRNKTFSPHSDDLDISSLIKTLSALSTLEWEQIGFIEDVSVIDHIFERSTNFPLLDRSTKNRYRLAVHQIVKNSLLSEKEVAELAVNLAQNNGNMEIDAKSPGDPYKSDIGYYLIDKGVPLLQKMSKMRLSVAQQFQQYCCPTISIFHYVDGILILALALSLLFFDCFDAKISNFNLHVLAAICTFLVSTQWANEIVNYFATKLVVPTLLPRFDFDKTGIPKQFRTIVVVPCLISNFESINSLISKLEIRFLGNQDENLDFALLTDFEDANREILPDDQSLLDYLKSKILRLNAIYSKIRNNGTSIFYAFHRPRVFNPTDNIWMGYERKRGKLAEFNNFLRGIETEKFNFIVGDVSKLEHIQYVITLDTDTSLPKDFGRKLVGTMAHPLNRPVFRNSHVHRGYGILQPRISLNRPVANSSVFSKIFSANYIGLDPYSRAISNVYQDLFGESSYIGKGIYDVDVFQKMLTGKFPKNRILSHDLLEGNCLRTGFVGDIQLYEDFPQTYVSDLVRRHRWIRGDWQNVNYIGDKNFSCLSKWKIFDNLRRSLIPLAELSLFLIYWQTLPILFLLGMKIVFSSVVQDLISFPKLFLNFNRKSKYLWDIPGKNDIIASLTGIWSNFLLFFFEISCLPNEAFHSFDAIIHSMFRLTVSKKNLLEWTASASSVNDSGSNFRNIFSKMWSGPLVFLVIIVSMKTETTLLPILFCWGLSPLLTWSLSQSSKIIPKQSALSSHDISFLRRIARKTWAYFEQFNTAEENYLPPDNYQEIPNELIAHRTSPTNIGLAVLSNLTAYDFGYLSCAEMVQRVSNTFKTLVKLEKYRGHLYNWYNTQSTKILSPKYVSTVDSGNYAASLLVLRQGLLTLPNENFVTNRIFEGLLDTFRLSFEELETLFLEEGLQLRSFLEDAIKKPNSLAETFQYLQSMQTICSNISDSFVDPNQTFAWFNKFERQLAAALGELLKFAPWLKLGEFPDEYKCFGKILNSLVSLRALAEFPLTIQPQFEKVTTVYTSSKAEKKIWLENLKEALNFARKNALQMINSLEELAKTCENLTDQMEYDFLYDTQRRLLRIGCDVEKNLPDDSCYDLIASEARLGIFVVIAQGKVPQETWLKLGRKLTKKSKVLQSWTGSMFEYLMPQLLMPTFENTLLSRTLTEIVKIQIDYGRANNIPWGISESSCSTWVESSNDYFYRAAGIKELSLDPKLENSFAIAPYATMLALMVCPKEACLNLKEMSCQEFEGSYGFYEAVDFTPGSLATGEKKKIVRSFMAHHQAMSFLALENVLLNEPMQRRFEEDPKFQSCMILLK